MVEVMMLEVMSHDPSICSHFAFRWFPYQLDNMVARFNLVSNELGDAGNTDFTKLFPKNATALVRLR
jgi:hypothetical protein